MTTRRVPPGGAVAENGTVLTRTDVTKAVRRYARKMDVYARTVRTITCLFRRAVNEYAAKRGS